LPAPIEPMLCGRRFRLAAGGTAYPSLFVMVWSAPPTSSGTVQSPEKQSLRAAAWCSAVCLRDTAGTAHRLPAAAPDNGPMAAERRTRRRL
jgi:hypothetical protein